MNRLNRVWRPALLITWLAHTWRPGLWLNFHFTPINYTPRISGDANHHGLKPVVRAHAVNLHSLISRTSPSRNIHKRSPTDYIPATCKPWYAAVMTIQHLAIQLRAVAPSYDLMAAIRPKHA